MTSTFLYGQNVHSNGIRQHFLRYGGSGLPILLLPGITSPAVTWGFVAERLGRHFDVYVLDVRGRGLSEAADHLDYTIDGCAGDVGALADTLGLKRYAIVAHSFGARIAVRAARKHPAGLERMVLVDPPVSGPGRRPYPADIGWYLESIRMAQQGSDYEAMRPFLPTWTDAQLRLRAEWLHTCDLKAVADAYTSFHEDDMHGDLPHLSIPIRLIAAGRGDVIRDAELDEMVGLAPNMTAVRVPGAGHMVPWDDEAGFYAALGDFLGQTIDAGACA